MGESQWISLVPVLQWRVWKQKEQKVSLLLLASPHILFLKKSFWHKSELLSLTSTWKHVLSHRNNNRTKAVRYNWGCIWNFMHALLWILQSQQNNNTHKNVPCILRAAHSPSSWPWWAVGIAQPGWPHQTLSLDLSEWEQNTPGILRHLFAHKHT